MSAKKGRLTMRLNIALFAIGSLFFAFSKAFATTIPIRNDTRYPLIATLISADHKVLSSSRIEPGHLFTWSDSYHGASNWEKGPFRVTFHCPNGAFYGQIYPVNDKLQVYARSAQGGSKRCSLNP